MLSQELRPFTFEEVAGQKENIKILKAIIKRPENAPKSIILSGAFGCGKTTNARIMARELNKKFDKNLENRDYNILNSPYYFEFDATVVGNIDEIRRLRDMFTVSYGDYWRVIVFDECMSYNTKILLEDGIYQKIGEVVENKRDVKVMSYNSSTGKVEPKKITGWFKNSPKIFYKVKTTKQKGYLECSENHIFITPDGEKALRDLQVGSEIYRYEPSLSREQLGFLVGTLLGDSSISCNESSEIYCPRFTMTQGEEQLDWLRTKTFILNNLLPSDDLYSNDNYGTYAKSFKNSHRVYERKSKSLICLRDISKCFMVEGKRKVSRELLDLLTPAGIAAWYLDDGQRNDRVYKGENIPWRIKLHTSGFSEDGQDIIIDYFREVWGINFKKEFYGYWYVETVSKTDTDKFYKLISEEIPKGVMDYKIPDSYSLLGKMLNIPKGEDVTVDKITSIERVNDTPEDSYDIEVEDNHNYFAGGILVHNCHAISNAAQTALLKVLEDSVGNNIFVLCTTHPQKLLPTIRSRSLELQFDTVPEEDVVANLTKVSEERGISVPEDIKELIANRSNGHMRNAHMLLDKFVLLGEQDFRDSVHSALDLYCGFFEAALKSNKEDALTCLNTLMNIPKDSLQQDFNTFMDESLKVVCGFEIKHKSVDRLVKLYGAKNYSATVAQFFFAPWFSGSAFIDMPYFQAAFLYLYSKIDGLYTAARAKQAQVDNTATQSGRFGGPIR